MPANFFISTPRPSEGDEPEPSTPEGQRNEPHEPEPPHLDYAPAPEEGESFDDEGMSVQKRRLLVLAAVVFLAVFIFIWNVFLNFGKLVVIAEPPYSVLIFDEAQHECSQNPCEIKLKRGEKNLSFFKLGYKTEGKTVEVPIWDKVEITPIFELEPYAQEIEKFEEKPFVTATIGYKIEYDPAHHNWKLFKTDDKSKRGLSYFPEKLKNPLIFGSNSAVLIIERDTAKAVSQIYFVDLKTGERGTISNEKPFKITAAKPSLNGKYFLLKIEGENPAMMMAGKNGLIPVNTPEAFANSLWTPFNKLIIVTKINEEKEYGIFLYNPEENSTKILIDSIKLKDNILNLFVSPLFKKIYIESSAKKLQVVY